MYFKIFVTGLFFLTSLAVLSENNPLTRKKETDTRSVDSIKISIEYLQKHLKSQEDWQIENPEISRAINGLIHYAEDERIDSILLKLEKFQENQDFKYITRSPSLVKDSLKISGFNS